MISGGIALAGIGNGNYEDINACLNIENCTYELYDDDLIGYLSVYKLSNIYKNIGFVPMLCQFYTEEIDQLYKALNQYLVEYKLWWVTELTISEEYRHKGYGSKLLNFIKNSIDDNTIIVLHAYNLTDNQNHKAIVSFYENNVFEKIYKKDDGSYIMLYSNSIMFQFIIEELKKSKKY